MLTKINAGVRIYFANWKSLCFYRHIHRAFHQQSSTFHFHLTVDFHAWRYYIKLDPTYWNTLYLSRLLELVNSLLWLSTDKYFWGLNQLEVVLFKVFLFFCLVLSQIKWFLLFCCLKFEVHRNSLPFLPPKMWNCLVISKNQLHWFLSRAKLIYKSGIARMCCYGFPTDSYDRNSCTLGKWFP